MLHGLSVSRPLIKAAMGFAFDKVESAKEVMLLAVTAIRYSKVYCYVEQCSLVSILSSD
jgi:hypothetical protein